MSTRTFPLSVIISFLTGTLVVNREDGGMTTVQNFTHFFENFTPGTTTYSGVYTESLREKLRAEFHRRYPVFAQVKPEVIDETNWQYWLERWTEKLGATVEVTAMTNEEVKTCFEN